MKSNLESALVNVDYGTNVLCAKRTAAHHTHTHHRRPHENAAVSNEWRVHSSVQRS